jgi:GNAT superfamily N-acetyltransferase
MAASPPRPLSEQDDRKTFDCGRDSLNQWFRRHAWSNHVNGTSRVNVIEDTASGRIIGYVALSSSQIERAFLPKAQQCNSPDPVPVTLLGQLAVDKDYQGQRHAASLLKFALFAALRASADVGSFGVITHPLDNGVRRYYANWGFEDLPQDPRRAMIVRMADLQSGLKDKAD